MDWRPLFDVNPRLLTQREGRVAVTAKSPLRFALTYCRKHMRSLDGTISLAEAHLEWDALARDMIFGEGVGQLRGFRHSFAAPRECAKTTWWFLFIPLWVAAHGYKHFIGAFADSATQAEEHLMTFKNELENNELLRHDFPELATPKIREGGTRQADRRGMYVSQNNFIFVAKGIDSSNLGMKVGHQRPDMIILDDVEGDEASYSVEQSKKRLGTITDAIMPLNERASVVLTGTVTMAGSIIHQTVEAASGVIPEAWVDDEGFTCHYHSPVLVDDEGNRRSIWPEKWPLEYQDSISHTRAYKKNFLNKPMAMDGNFWREDLFKYGRLTTPSIRLLSVDPHVKRSKTSDFTGLAVIYYSVAEDRFEIVQALNTKLRGKELRSLVLRLGEVHSLTAVLIETNQGGDLWLDEGGVFHGLPYKVMTVHQSESKEIRAERAVVEYEAGRVLHREELVELETTMCAFPRVAHDDIVDAVTSGIVEIRKRAKSKAPKTGSAQHTWRN